MSSDAAITDLCGRIFADPSRLLQTVAHVITAPYRIEPHAHRDVLQFDLFEDCAGIAQVAGERRELAGVSVLTAYPGEEHGYELRGGTVFNVKLRVVRNWLAVKSGPWPALRTDLNNAEALAASLRVVTRLGLVSEARPPLLLSRLSEALSLWPRANESDELPGVVGEELEPTMAAAVALIEQRLNDPPSVQELAGIAAYSPRHFTRRFHALFGCPPRDYIAARRLAATKQMLIEDRRTINRIAEDLGFASAAQFSRWFAREAGVSPSRFRGDPGVM